MKEILGQTCGSVLTSRAPAKVNLTLHVLGRRPDGYHELESLVVFAGIHDRLTLVPGRDLSLLVEGPTAGAAGPPESNLVIRAARALAERRSDLAVGAFHLVKRLPAAAGIGGGSSDAAAALRLLAELNGLALDHPDIVHAARATGADVPVCLDPRARMMRGAGEEVGPPLVLSPLFAVLVNPGVAVPTAGVFKALGLAPGQNSDSESRPRLDASYPPPCGEGGLGQSPSRVGVGQEESRRPEQAEGPPPPTPPHKGEGRRATIAGLGVQGEDLLAHLVAARNDLEPPALALAPAIGIALSRLRRTEGCRLARMSGSGATVFGLYDDGRAAARAAKSVRAAEPDWWIRATLLR